MKTLAISWGGAGAQSGCSRTRVRTRAAEALSRFIIQTHTEKSRNVILVPRISSTARSTQTVVKPAA